MDYHKQCQIRKGDRRQVAWIPMKYAEPDRYIKIKVDGEWEDGWQVAFVGRTKMESKEIADRRNDHKNMKKMTDVSKGTFKGLGVGK